MTITAPPVPASRASRRAVPVGLALAAASLPMFMSTLDNLVMTSALPVIQHALSASVEQLQWMMNSYTLAFATLMLPAATLGDRWGRRRVFLIGITVFTLASIGSALSTTTSALIAARALQGAGGAAIMPLSLTLLAAAVPASRRAMAIGVWGGVSGLGVALGPVIGGAVIDGFSWQAIFWLNVPVAIVAIPLILRALPESVGRRQPLDVLGLALVGAGVLAAVWGIVRGSELGWGSLPVAVALVAGVALIAAFIRHEGRTAYPLVPLRLFRSRSFSVANVASLAFTIGMFGAVFLLAQYLQIVDGYTPLQAGIRTLPWTAAPMIVAPIAGLLAPRVGVRVLLGTGLSLQARLARLARHGRWRLDPLHRPGFRLHPGRDRDGADIRAELHGRAGRHGPRRPCHGKLDELHDPGDRRRIGGGRPGGGVPRERWHPHPRGLQLRPARGHPHRRGRRGPGRTLHHLAPTHHSTRPRHIPSTQLCELKAGGSQNRARSVGPLCSHGPRALVGRR